MLPLSIKPMGFVTVITTEVVIAVVIVVVTIGMREVIAIIATIKERRS